MESPGPNSKLRVGQGVPRLSEPTPAEGTGDADKASLKPPVRPEPPEVSQPAELQYVRADGTPYDQLAAKNISDNPIHRINVEVDAEGNEVEWDKPIIKDQYINPLYRRTWRQDPQQHAVFDLGDPEQLKAWNELQMQGEPVGAPRVWMVRATEKFDENTGSWKVLAVFRRIHYKKIVSTT